MPRTKTNPEELYVRELRITPPDQEEIADWKLGDDFKVAIFAKEGGVGTGKQLHYHGYIESFRSASKITKWIYDIAHCHNGERGNAVFFSRQPHDNTIGYVVKHGDIVCRHGVEETFITEWIERSSQYRRDKDAVRKRTNRSASNVRGEIIDEVKQRLEEHEALRYEEQVVGMLLAGYCQRGLVFPPRSTIENIACSILYKYHPELINAFYCKNLSLHREYNKCQ